MAQLFSYDHVGVKDEVANTISNLGEKLVKELPFTKSIGKKKVKNQKHEWQVDFDEKPSENAYPEDIDWADIDDAYTPTIMLNNYAQKMMVSVKVTAESQVQAYWADSDQMKRQSNKKARKLLRDWEYACLNNGAAVAPSKDPVTGESLPAKMGGIKTMISSKDGGVTIEADPLTGAVTFATSTSVTPTEQDILDMLEQLWIAGADVEIIMVSASMKDVISGMQEEDGRRVRVFENAEKITFEVNTITDALGSTVKVIYNRLMPANTVFFYNSADWQEAVFRAPAAEEAPKNGDYKKAILSQTLGLEHRNPWASGIIVGADTVLTGVSLTMSATTGVVGTAITSNATPTPAPAIATGVTYSYAMSALAGLTCNAATGKVTGTPTAAGTATITVTAAQGGVTKTGTATIVVSAS